MYGDQTLHILAGYLSNCAELSSVPRLVSKQYWTETFDAFFKSCTLAFESPLAMEEFVLCPGPILALARRISIELLWLNDRYDVPGGRTSLSLNPGVLKSLEGLHMDLCILDNEVFNEPLNFVSKNRQFRDIVRFFQQLKLKKDLTQVSVKDWSGSNHDTQELSDVIRKHLLDYQGVAETEGSPT